MPSARAFIRTSIAVVAFAATAIVFTVVITSTAQPPAVPGASDPSDVLRVHATVARLGLTPDALAAAGVTSAQVGPMVQNIQEYLDEHGDELRLADQQCAAHARTTMDAERQRSAGSTPASDAPATAQVQAAVSARQQLLDSALAAAMAGIGAEEVARLAAIRRNARWEVPIEYTVTDRTEAEWVALRNAVARQRQDGLTSSTPAAASESAVIAARNSLQQRGVVMEALSSALPDVDLAR